MSERYYRRAPDSLSASLPSQALRASSPKGRALGISVKFPLDEQGLSVSWTVVPCCPGQRQLDKVRLSRSRCLLQQGPLFCAILHLGRPVGSGPACQSLSLWERWHCEAMTERASPARKSRCAAMGRLFVRAILSSRSRFFVSILALSGAPRPCRVAAPSVCCAAACILLAAAPTAPPCFRRWRRSSPLPPKGEPFIWKKRQTRICLFFHALIALLSPSFSA